MSKPGLPNESLAKSAGADALPDEEAPFDPEVWLKPHEKSMERFHLEPKGGKSTSPAWNFCQVITGSKLADTDPDLPPKWIKKSDVTQFACCNSCGELIPIGTHGEGGKVDSQRTTGIDKHIKSNHLKGGLQKLEKKRIAWAHSQAKAKAQAQGKPVPKLFSSQSSLKPHATATVIPPKFRVVNQHLHTTKFIVDQLLPFDTVKAKSFRELVESHNEHAKKTHLGVDGLKDNIEHIHDAMKEAALNSMEGKKIPSKRQNR